MREVSEHRVYEFEDFRLEADHLLLFRNGEQLALTPKVIETLLALIERHGDVVSKDELMQILWPDTIVEESNLSQNLYILRKTLGRASGGGPFIETLRRRGYRFGLDVRFTNEQFTTPEPSRPLRIERSDNIYSVVEWRREHTGNGPVTAAEHRRPAWLAPLIAITVVIASAGLIFGVYKFAGGGKPKAAIAAAIPFRDKDVARLTTAGRTKHAAISPDGRYITHVTEDAEGSKLWVRQVSGTTDVRIAGPAASEFVWTAFAPDGNHVYYLSLDRDKGDTELYRVPVLGGPAVKAANDTGPVAFSPDGTSMVFIRQSQGESRIIVAGIDGTNERVLSKRSEPEYYRINWNAPAWSPDGKTIACPARLVDNVGHYDTIVGINAADGSERTLTSGRWQQVGQPQWLANGLFLTAAERTTGPQQIWHIAMPDGVATRITHDLNDYYDLSLTADGTRLSAVQNHVVSSLWVSQDGRAANSKQVGSEAGGLQDLAWMRDSRLAYLSNAGGGTDIWIMDGNGANARQLTTGVLANRGMTISPDGRQIVFSSERTGRSNIWSVDADGTNLRQLTNSDGELYPQYTPDGQWIVFQRGEIETTLWRIPTAGGEAVQVISTRASRPAISPDGSMVAFPYLDPKLDKSRWSIGIIPVEGGARLKRFDFPPTVTQRFVRWMPDGKSIAFVNTQDGGSDIWLQPVDGGRPFRLTDFKAANIVAFDWAPDGHTLAVISATETSDVVLIDNVARQ